MSERKRGTTASIDIDALLQDTWLQVISLRHGPRFQEGEGRQLWERCIADVERVQRELKASDLTIVNQEPLPRKPWKSFTAGMLTMLLIGAAGLMGWRQLNPAPVSPLPLVPDEASLETLSQLSGWHQGMDGLNDLARRLNALDERKGKYLTGSEL